MRAARSFETENADDDETSTHDEPSLSDFDDDSTGELSPTNGDESETQAEPSDTETRELSEIDDENGDSAETQLMAFVAPLPDSGEVSSVSPNLIDSSLIHLHGLMKQIGVEAVHKRTSPEMVNAVCNVAKNMRDLMKLKLDVYKQARS